MSSRTPHEAHTLRQPLRPPRDSRPWAGSRRVTHPLYPPPRLRTAANRPRRATAQSAGRPRREGLVPCVRALDSRQPRAFGGPGPSPLAGAAAGAGVGGRVDRGGEGVGGDAVGPGQDDVSRPDLLLRRHGRRRAPSGQDPGPEPPPPPPPPPPDARLRRFTGFAPRAAGTRAPTIEPA